MVSVICGTHTCLCYCFVQGVPAVILIMSNGVCHLWYMYLSVLLFCPGGSCGNSDHVKWCLSSVVHVEELIDSRTLKKRCPLVARTEIQ